MKVLEKTAERLVIQRGDSCDTHDLIWLSLWVNFIVTICFVEISKSSISQVLSPFALSFAIGALLVYFLFPVNRKQNSFGYWFAVAFGSTPFLGVGLLSFVAFGILVTDLQFPSYFVLTLNKGKDIFTLKSKFLYWYYTIQYPLNELTGATRSTIRIYTGSMTVMDMPALQLDRTRSQDGKRLQKALLFSEKDINFVVYSINRFLLE